MISYNHHLPQAGKLDIGALSRIFKSTSTSYKFLFFLALLNILQTKHRQEDEIVQITLEDIAVEMALLGWYPIKFYKLSFGLQDQVANIINKLVFDPSFKAITSTQGQAQLRAAIKDQSKAIGLYALLRFVPYRLQSTFFSKELKGVAEKSKNDTIIQLSQQNRSSTLPLYRFVQHNNLSAIEVNKEWVKYLLHDANINIVRDWALWEWVNYLQKRNPSTPSIINKVLPPIKRSSLSTQTHYWKAIIKADTSLRCIYSGEPLINQPFSLDHFLPWTFVCHDQIWNLCPVTPSSNSSKGNKLPAEDYVEKFIEQQIRALNVSADIMKPNAWGKATETYALDLHLAPERLLDQQAVYQAYSGVLKPMMALAEQSGFESHWQYDS